MKPGDIQISINQVQDEDLKINLQQENVLNINIDQHNVLDDISTTIHTGYLLGLDRVAHTEYFSGDGTEFFPLNLSEYTISWIDSKLTNNQGVENYGRPMVVGSDGNIIPGIFPDNAVWGKISGKLTDQKDLAEELANMNNTANETKNLLDSHITNVDNPHNVTKEQVGLGNVDNTSDLDKPISTATQAALDLKADQSTTYSKTEVDDLLEPKLDATTASSTYATITNLNAHTSNVSNPHSVTKEQVGLGNVDNTSDKDKPVSDATQAALDLKADQSTTYTKAEVDDLLEPKLDSSVAADTYATITNLNNHTSNVSNPHSVTKEQVGLGNVDNTSDANKPVSTAQQAALDLKADKDTTYTKTETDVAIETTLTNYVKFTDYASQSVAGVIKVETTNGLYVNNKTGILSGNPADLDTYNTSTSYFVISKGTLENIKDDYVKRGITENSIKLTDTEKESARTWIGAGSQEDVTSIETDISTIESKIPSTASSTNLLADRDFVNSSINNMAAFYITSNVAGDAFPTKATLVAGPYYFQGELRTPTLNDYAIVIEDETKENASTRYMYDGVQWDFQYEINNTAFTQDQVNAINSTATKDKIDSYSAHIINNSNPHSVTKDQVGLGNVDNTSDSDKPISTATQAALDLKANIEAVYNKEEVDDLLEPKLDATTASSTYATITNLNNHIDNKSNPHSVTKAQVGLGNVDNTSDANKPVSTAQQAALDLKADQSTTYNKTEVDDLLSPKLDSETAADTYATITNLNAHTSNVSNPHSVTKAQVGLGNVDNTSDSDKPISTATQAALDLKADQSTTYTKDEVDDKLDAKLDTTTASSTYATITNLNAHTSNVSNPHSVTKAQVGLDNVDNTSDLDKPISTATQAALDLKADQSTTYSKTEVDDLLEPKLDSSTAATTYATITNLNNHINSKSNPHSVTKAQVGLGNVDNTSDLNKPISTATQEALDGKQAKGDYATNTTVTTGLNTKVDIAQGAENAGKALIIGDDGNVTVGSGGGVNATYDATNYRITFA